MPRELEPRDFVPLVREREPLLRDPLLRGDFAAPLLRGDFAAPLALFAAPDFRAADERLAPEVDDFARVEGFFAAAERVLLAAPLVERFAVELEADDFRAPLARAELVRDPEEVDPELLPESSDHLPDMTRCAASATASAMSDPSLVALETTLLAACEAVSAASSPASRIFLRAAGLAAIAAAAAVSPAAIISLLIAALASLSTVLSPEPELAPERADEEPERLLEEPEREDLVRADLAIASLPASRKRHFRAVPVP